MRVLLKVFVLATAAVAWAAASHVPASARAAVRAAPDGADAAYPPAAPDAPGAENRTDDHGEGAEGRAEREPAVIAITLPGRAPVDAVPVSVVLVDGENGDEIDSFTIGVERGPETHVEFRVAAPGGYVAETNDLHQLKACVSRRAERLRVIEPLRREADIRVRVVGAGGRPVVGARVTEAFRGGGPPGIVALASEIPEVADEIPDEPPIVEIDLGAGVPLARSAPSGVDGWLRIRGVPHLLDERYWIVVGRGRSDAYVDVLLAAFGERHAVEVKLPLASTRVVASSSAIGIGGGCGGSFRCRTNRREPASLDVLVRLRDGRMGAGLNLLVGTAKGVTDGSGRVTFAGLRPGTYVVEVRDPDFIWAETQVELREAERRTFVLSEGPGWTARALLLDSTGRPVPFARVGIWSKAPVPYLRVEDGVQDLVFLTDARGEIRVPDLHHAAVSLDFLYGSRSASVTLDESDPCATVRLPPP
jgi:hypothetical protein